MRQLKREAAAGGVLLKKVFLKISQNPQENTCASLFCNKHAGLKNTIFTDHFPWLLLQKPTRVNYI